MNKGTDRCLKKQEKALREARLIALACPELLSELARTLPVPVPESALSGWIPERICELTKPKNIFPRHSKCVRNVRPTDSAKNLDANPTTKPAKPAKRAPRSFPRTELLSQPRPTRIHARCAKLEYENTIDYHSKRHHMKVGSKDWIDHQKWLEENAKPKKVFTRPIETKVRSTMTRQQMEESVNRLSTVPAHRQYSKMKPKIHKTKPARPHGPIVPLDLPFVNRLSTPKKLKQETLNDPQKKFRRSRHYKGNNTYIARKSTT